MPESPEDFLKCKRWAVVGVSADERKYGYKAFAALLNAGYEVYGVNPKNGIVLGQRIYRSLADLPQRPEVVNTVVPPRVTESVVRQCAELGIGRVWMQPGSESDHAIAFCREHGIEVVHNQCAILRAKDSA